MKTELLRMHKCYVYRHIRLDKNTPFYVGKGVGTRAWSHQRNKYWHNIVKKSGYIVEIIRNNLTENEALDFEFTLIALYKSFNYCEANVLVGGRLSVGKNNPMYGQGHKLKGSKNGMYGKIGKMKGRFGKKHPKFGKKESNKTRYLKRLAHLKNKKWIYITPNGKFNSLTKAADSNKVSNSSVKARCTSKNFLSWDRERIEIQ